jgi:hypothetical protein
MILVADCSALIALACVPMPKVLVVFGARPEAIKRGRVVAAIRAAVGEGA